MKYSPALGLIFRIALMYIRSRNEIFYFGFWSVGGNPGRSERKETGKISPSVLITIKRHYKHSYNEKKY